MRSEYLIIVYLDSVRVTENAFCTFRVFSVRNNLNENNVSIVELVPLSLHNFLHASWFTPPGFTDEIQTDGNISNDTWHYEASSEFLCPLETTKLVQNFCALWKLPSKINTVKMLKEFPQLLSITFVALVKFQAWPLEGYKCELLNENRGAVDRSPHK